MLPLQSETSASGIQLYKTGEDLSGMCSLTQVYLSNARILRELHCHGLKKVEGIGVVSSNLMEEEVGIADHLWRDWKCRRIELGLGAVHQRDLQVLRSKHMLAPKSGKG